MSEATAALRLWAPSAAAVDVELDRVRHAMVPGSGGWWTSPVTAAAGARYGFSVDGGPVRPDPRSASQPDGVHGRSEVVDHGAFRWGDDGWAGFSLPDAVLYELHVGTFTPEGTFDAAVGRLDHLVGLGVDAVELMPVATFPGRHGWGYDGVGLFAPHQPYGGVDGLKGLVDACHRRGLGVILDVVYNHLGPSGNHLGELGPYFTDRYRTPWGDAINYDGPDSDEVRAFAVDNAVMWLRDYHMDGLRLDAVHAIVDTSAVHLLEDITTAVGQLSDGGWRRFVIAESDLNDPRVVAPLDRGGYGCDAQWSDDFHHAVHAVLTGEGDGYYADFGSLGQLGTALGRAFVYAGEHSPHRRRRHGRAPRGIPATRFLGYSQNHDQVGNRARGERLCHLVSGGRAKAAAALVLTAPFVPMLFQGEEWAASSPFQYFTDHDDAELGAAVREGRRREFAAFGWAPEDVPDPQDPATFRRSILPWDERVEEGHAGFADWYRSLIGLRRRHPELRDGSFVGPGAIDIDEAAATLALRRGPVTVLVNLGATTATFAVAGRPAGTVIVSGPDVGVDEDTVALPPDGVAVLGP